MERHLSESLQTTLHLQDHVDHSLQTPQLPIHPEQQRLFSAEDLFIHFIVIAPEAFKEAWEEFLEAITDWIEQHSPPGYQNLFTEDFLEDNPNFLQQYFQFRLALVELMLIADQNTQPGSNVDQPSRPRLGLMDTLNHCRNLLNELLNISAKCSVTLRQNPDISIQTQVDQLPVIQQDDLDDDRIGDHLTLRDTLVKTLDQTAFPAQLLPHGGLAMGPSTLWEGINRPENSDYYLDVLHHALLPQIRKTLRIFMKEVASKTLPGKDPAKHEKALKQALSPRFLQQFQDIENRLSLLFRICLTLDSSHPPKRIMTLIKGHFERLLEDIAQLEYQQGRINWEVDPLASEKSSNDPKSSL